MRVEGVRGEGGRAGCGCGAVVPLWRCVVAAHRCRLSMRPSARRFVSPSLCVCVFAVRANDAAMEWNGAAANQHDNNVWIRQSTVFTVPRLLVTLFCLC